MTLQFSRDAVAEALIRSRGILSEASRILDCDRVTVYRYLERFPDLVEIQTQAREILADSAEDALWKLVQEGDGPTVRWVLKSLRSGVFGDKLDLTAKVIGDAEKPIHVQVEAANQDADRVQSILQIMAEAGVLVPSGDPGEAREGTDP